MDTNKPTSDDELVKRQKELEKMLEEHREFYDRKDIYPQAPAPDIYKRRYNGYDAPSYSERPCIRVDNRGANALLDQLEKPAPKPNDKENED